MPRPAQIHKNKQPIRFHYIPEWANHRHLRQADIVRELSHTDSGVDKSTVSRWFKGSIPVEKHLVALAGLLGAGEPAALFRHPDDDWIARLLHSGSKERREQVVRMIRAAYEEAA